VVAPRSYGDIPRAAAVHGRTLAHIGVQAKLLRGPGMPWPPAFTLMPLPVPSHGSKVHTIAVRDGMAAAAAALGFRHGSTPFSIGGPDCSGSPIALAMEGRFPAVAAAALGAEALFDPPFALPAPAGAAPGDFRARFARIPCRLCGGSGLECVYHLALECPHVAMQQWRRTFAASLPAAVTALWTSGLRALRDERRGNRVDAAPPPASPAALAGVAQLCTEPPNLGLDENRRLAYKLLIAVTWCRPTAPAVATAAGPSYVALGWLFDALNVRHQRLRGLTQNWLVWSERSLCSLAHAWQSALTAAGHAVPTASPTRASASRSWSR